MKKVLTAMTAISMTLQANDNLNENLNNPNNQSTDKNTQSIPVEVIKNEILSQHFSDNPMFKLSNTNAGTLGASGSFLTVDKFVRLGFDPDASGTVTAGDILIYDIFTRNSTEINASGTFLGDIPDTTTSLIPGSVISTQGTIFIGNNPNDTSVSVAINDLNSYDTSLVSFAVKVNSIADGQIVDISNQALVETINMGSSISDNPNTGTPFDSTDIKAFGSTTLLYDESESGDFVEHYETPTQTVLSSELEQVTGEVGGAGLDLEDCFQFDVESSRRINAIVLENYQPTFDNQDTLFQIFNGLPPIKVSYGDVINRSIDASMVGNNLMYSYQVLYPGTYSVCLVDATPGQKYSLVIQSEITDPIFKNNFE